MVRIGKLNIGSSATSEKVQLSLGEAQIVWDYLSARYLCIENTQIWGHFAHDPDLKFFIHKEMKNTLEKEANELEKELDKAGLPQPKRPPKSVSPASSIPETFTDEHIFNLIHTGCGDSLYKITQAIRESKNNDALRKRFMGYLQNETEIYDDLTKFGKVKGWLQVPPLYSPH